MVERLKTRLTSGAIQAELRMKRDELRPCIASAIANEEVTPGRHTIYISARIKPSGEVADTKMIEPYYLLSTSLPECLANTMRTLKFEPSLRGGVVQRLTIPFRYRP